MHGLNPGNIRAQLISAYCGFPGGSSPFTRPFSSTRGDVAPLLVRLFSSVAGTGGESASPFVGAGAAGVSGSVGTGIAYYFRRTSYVRKLRSQRWLFFSAQSVTTENALCLSARC